MPFLEPKQVCEVIAVTDDAEFNGFIRSDPSGLAIVAELYGRDGEHALPSETGDFVKWIKRNNSTIRIETHDTKRLIVRRSIDLWLPLVFLANDIALPVYLNLVSSYLYEKMKGALKGEVARVHMSVEYEDKQAGIIKRFNFEGDAESLKAAIKRFDLNHFLDE